MEVEEIPVSQCWIIEKNRELNLTIHVFANLATMRETDDTTDKGNAVKQHVYNLATLILIIVAVFVPSIRVPIFYFVGSLQMVMSMFQIVFYFKGEKHPMIFLNLILSTLMIIVVGIGLFKPGYDLYAIFYLGAMQLIHTFITIYKLHIKKS